jgi:hypothetical protein
LPQHSADQQILCGYICWLTWTDGVEDGGERIAAILPGVLVDLTQKECGCIVNAKAIKNQ